MGYVPSAGQGRRPFFFHERDERRLYRIHFCFEIGLFGATRILRERSHDATDHQAEDKQHERKLEEREAMKFTMRHITTGTMNRP